ncbi:uncharacterized protein LOC114355642 [Ostrinia furnacalis]|uniref:uncharacterized protein LOC114355642 n=1 Tax=Ostrinia furnacalis TaxID=93504 RepID=UPI00103CB839|nr:uncharacterized protein LOC114355642 [Ostrinia furnacalis]
MIVTWQHLIKIIIVVQLNYAVGLSPVHKVANPRDWKIVESLAEEYPYIVALLNASKDYMCTGIIVNKKTVLTSGSCIDPDLYYIAVGSAVLSKSINNNSLFEIAATRIHSDYVFDLRPYDPNVTRLHSNIGLVFSVRSELEAYIPHADLGNYYASELQDKNVKVVGYGKISTSNMYVLQHQAYHQTPCMNPKWYYCICGYEYSAYSKTYEQEFGKGAPVFLRREVIGVAASPCGAMELPDGIKYNIFTVIGPYMSWIQKEHPNITKPIVFRTRNRAHSSTGRCGIYILFIISKVIY